MAVWNSRGCHLLWRAVVWAFCSRDIASRSYLTTALNQDELCWTVATITGLPFERIAVFRDEVLNDTGLAAHMRQAVANSPERWSHAPDYQPGRRLAYYLLARAIRPRRVIESGVDRGFGATLICRALARNAAEGAAGDYIGIDRKGEDDAFLYTSFSEKSGHIERGDAASILRSLPGAGSLIIHDTGINPDHVAEIGHALDEILADDTVIISSWVTPVFMDLARRRNRGFLSHKDSAPSHWKSPSRLCFVFPRPAVG